MVDSIVPDAAVSITPTYQETSCLPAAVAYVSLHSHRMSGLMQILNFMGLQPVKGCGHPILNLVTLPEAKCWMTSLSPQQRFGLDKILDQILVR